MYFEKNYLVAKYWQPAREFPAGSPFVVWGGRSGRLKKSPQLFCSWREELLSKRWLFTCVSIVLSVTAPVRKHLLFSCTPQDASSLSNYSDHEWYGRTTHTFKTLQDETPNPELWLVTWNSQPSWNINDFTQQMRISCQFVLGHCCMVFVKNCSFISSIC